MPEYFDTQVTILDELLRRNGVTADISEDGLEFEVLDNTALGQFSIRLAFVPPDDASLNWLVVIVSPQIQSLGVIGDLIDDLLDVEGIVDCEFDVVDGSARMLVFVQFDMEPTGYREVVDDARQLFEEIAIEHYAAGGVFYEAEHAGALVTPGFHELDAVGKILAGGKAESVAYALAKDLLSSAITHFTLADLDWHSLFCRLAQADAAHVCGDVEESLRLGEQILSELRQLDYEDLTATALHLLFAAEHRLGNQSRAAALIDEALLIGERISHDEVANWQSDRDAFVGMTSGNIALALDTARFRLRNTPEGDTVAWTTRAVELGRSLTAAGNENEGIGIIREALARARQAALEIEAEIGIELAASLVETQRFDEALLLLNDYEPRLGVGAVLARKLATDLRFMCGDPDVKFGNDSSGYEALVNRGSVLYQAGKFKEALSCFEEADPITTAAGNRVAHALNRANLAAAKIALGVTSGQISTDKISDELIHDLLPAIATAEEVRHSLTTSNERSSWASKLGQVYEMALGMCRFADEHGLAIELIERMKVQGMPDSYQGRLVGRGEQQNSGVNSVPAVAAALRTGTEVISPPHHYSVGGVSRLAPLHAKTMALERRAEAQGGEGAWWWTMWSGSAGVFWGVVNPIGKVFSGRLDKSSDLLEVDSLAPDLEKCEAALSSPGRGLDGLFGADHEEFVRVFSSLGSKLIPEPLMEALAKASERDPVRIIYSPSSSMAWLPIGLLSAEGKGRRNSFRLLERAVVQLASPYTTPNESKRDRITSASHSISILDPTSEFPDLEDLVPGAELLMTGAVMQNSKPGTAIAIATRKNIINLLSQKGCSGMPVMLFGGHAAGPSRSDPLSGGLVCAQAEGEPALLTVRDLVERADALFPPRSVILCACSSARDSSDKYRERWGLGVGFLIAGAQAIVGSTWDLLDSPANSDFARHLREEFKKPGVDHALVVRNEQMRLLRAWENAVATEDSDLIPNLFPYYWAPWVVMTA